MPESRKSLLLNSVSSLFKGFFHYTQLQFSHSLYKGGQSPLLSRELFKRGPAVVALLYDLQNKKVVLVEQCRVGAVQAALKDNQPDKAWLLEPVAGMIDENETPEQAVIREVSEETGIEIEQCDYIYQYYPSPGACDEILWFYGAQINSDGISEHAGLAEDVEDIKVVSLSFSEAKDLLTKGELNVASTIMALQWLFYQKLDDNFALK